MKRIFLIIVLLFLFRLAFSQAPMIEYGEYQYVYSLDDNGDKIKKTAFQRIQPLVVTTNFMGLVQSSASYMYLTVTGMWQTSGSFSWAGFRNGWYVYTNRTGIDYSYFLISRDYEMVRIKESFQNGITNVYKRCNPNERMDNAPSY